MGKTVLKFQHHSNKRLAGIVFFIVIFLSGLHPSLMMGKSGSAVAGESHNFRSLGSIEFNGTRNQSRIHTTNLVRTTRRQINNKMVYELSMEGGLRVGDRDGLVGFKYAPFEIERNLETDHLTGSDKSLDLSLAMINDTIRQISDKSFNSGTWKENIILALGEYFPASLDLKFSAQPLPHYGTNSDVLLITIECGLFDYFLAGDDGQKVKINGSYKAVLVYSPTKDLLYQSVARFMALHGNELIRIENMQFLTGERGDSPRFPLVDTSRYLGFVQRGLNLQNEGTLPLWAVQSARVFELVNTAAMTAAEQSTNPAPILSAGTSFLKNIRDTANWLTREVGPEVGRDFLQFFKNLDDQFSRWWADLAKYNAKLKALSLDTASTALTLSTGLIMLSPHVSFLLGSAGTALTLYAMQSQFELIGQDIQDLMKAPKRVLPAKTKPIKPDPPPVQVKKAPKKGMNPGGVILLAGGAAVAAVGVAYLAKNLAGNSRECCKDNQRICNGSVVGLGNWVCCPSGSPLLASNGNCYPWGGVPAGLDNVLCRPGPCKD